MHCLPVSTCIRPSLNFYIITLSTYYLHLEYSQLYKSFLFLVRLFVYGVIKMFAAPIANCCPVLIQDPAIYHNLVLNNTNFYPVWWLIQIVFSILLLEHSTQLANFFSICIQYLKSQYKGCVNKTRELNDSVI